MFLTVGGYAQRNWDAYPSIKSTVDDLATDTGERTQFIVNENGERVYLYTSVGQSAVETGAQNGKRGPLHCSAAGKAILAAYPKSAFTKSSTAKDCQNRQKHDNRRIRIIRTARRDQRTRVRV